MGFEVLGIEVAYIHSAHARELADWYVDRLGLDLDYEDGHWFEFGVADGSRFAIDRTGSPRSPVENQRIVLSFRVDDIEAAVSELASTGIEFYPSPEKAIFEAGSNRVATFHDADGNWQQLSQRIH